MVEAQGKLQTSLRDCNELKEDVARLNDLLGKQHDEVVHKLQETIELKQKALEESRFECSQLGDRAVLLEKSRDAAEERMVEAQGKLQTSLRDCNELKEDVARLNDLLGEQHDEVVHKLQETIELEQKALEESRFECSQLGDRAGLLEKSRDAAEERMVEAQGKL